MNQSFIEFLIIALLSLGVTFVLFHYLQAYAEGQSQLLGGTIKYGGSLAGFALISVLFTQVYDSIVKTENSQKMGESTVVNLAGDYRMRYEVNNRMQDGEAHIVQEPGSPNFLISGAVGKRTFRGDCCYVGPRRRMYFLYENNAGEQGLAMGDLLSDRPDSIMLAWYDAYTFDVDGDTTGTMVLYLKK
jgi:hypothetical protein